MDLLDRVKIGHFIRSGIQIRGIVHIGANDGHEVEWYQELGIRDILCFEPIERIADILAEDYPSVTVIRTALGNVDGRVRFHISEGGTGNSSCLPDTRTTVTYDSHIVVPMMRWASLVSWNIVRPERYNCCVIDVQGMELDVLHGMDQHLGLFECFVIECSDTEPFYHGEAVASEVIAFMNRQGYKPFNKLRLREHNDVLFGRA